MEIVDVQETWSHTHFIMDSREMLGNHIAGDTTWDS